MKALLYHYPRRTGVLIGILLVLMTFAAAAPTGATLMQYTYTSHDLTFSGTFPDDPAIGNNVTVQFVMDDSTPLPWNQLVVTSTSGALTLTGTTPGVNTLTNGIPSFYDLSLISGSLPRYTISIQKTFGEDVRIFYSSATGDSASAYTRDPGVWVVSPVPCPAAVMLLGSGLIPLAWARRRTLWRK